MKLHKSGFTLIELLIVVVIMSLLFSVGYVNFRNFQQRQGVQSVVRSIKSDLTLTRENAASGIKPAGCVTLNGYQFTVVTSTQYTISASCTSGDIQTKVIDLTGGITINIPSPNPLLFKVLAVGTNIPTGGTYSITVFQDNLSLSQTIYVQATGEIDIAPAGTTPAPTPGPTNTPTSTPTSKPTPTPTPVPNCNTSCDLTKGCPPTLSCVSGFCRNASCSGSITCICP